MYKILIILLMTIGSTFLFSQSSETLPYVKIEMGNWGELFDEVSLDGTFALQKFGSDTIHVYNSERSLKQYLPASTYKILNSLISLQTEVISDENEIIEWDGVKRFYDKWNTDHSLKSAIKYSCVWFYQELARRIGEKQMQYFLDTVNYGNSKIGSDIDKFWLEGKLRISAIAQIQFLNNFLNQTLPFSKRNYDIVKRILLVDSTENYKLYAKTGWTARVDDQIGWYVGFIESDSNIWVFAMNIDINESEDSKYREVLTRKVLARMGILN